MTFHPQHQEPILLYLGCLILLKLHYFLDQLIRLARLLPILHHQVVDFLSDVNSLVWLKLLLQGGQAFPLADDSHALRPQLFSMVHLLLSSKPYFLCQLFDLGGVRIGLLQLDKLAPLQYLLPLQHLQLLL